MRFRDLGHRFGRFEPGPHNAITDVTGVRVGHSTVLSEGSEGTGPARTGVTAILPNDGNIFEERIVGSGFVLNGAGEIAGLTQVLEWGVIETPILLTNTLAVGRVSNAVVEYMMDRFPGIGSIHDVVIPVVGECDDSWLNDARARHVKKEHAFEAIMTATSGPVAEGNVGGGTGMVTCDLSGGIGTASRVLPLEAGGYVLGVLVMSNFGHLRDLRMMGTPVGNLLTPRFEDVEKREHSYGSIIAVLATDAPLLPHQLARVSKRVALGIGRVGSFAAHGSGEIVVSFSTANTVPRQTQEMIAKVEFLLDPGLNQLYEAAIETTEEAILNALCAAGPITGVDGHHAPALPLEDVRTILDRAAAISLD